MSASEEWNKRVAAMKEAREKKRAGSNAGSGSPLMKAASTSALKSPGSPANPSLAAPGARGGSRRGPSAGSRRGPRGSFRRGSPVRGAPGGPGNANAARELNLVKAELKILQMKYDNEVKKRESLEKQLQIAKESNASATVSRSRTSMTKNKSVRQSVAPQANVAELVTKVLAEMQRLEDNIKRADSQRNQAETELLEVAMLKQTADEALDNLIKDIGKRVVVLADITSNLRQIASSVPTAKAEIEAACDGLETIRKEMVSRMDKKAISMEKDKSFKRASVFVQKLDLSVPPPPAPTMGPPAIGPPSLGPTRANARVRAGPRESTLLTQIRKGQALNKIDPEALARERAQNRNNSRQSMALLSSLKDTLRMALNVRQEDMNLYGGDDDDGWDD